MNEELKIIIKVAAEEAKKNLDTIKKELGNIESNSKSLNDTMRSVAKGVTVAIGSIAALTAAIANLGRAANDIDKGLGKLKSSFENAGSSAKEATKYYKELFGVLGDHDRAIETGQSLARITTNPEALSEYKNIMAGVVSQYGDGYNTEALAENISETIAEGALVGDLTRVFIEAGISAESFNNSLSQISSTEEREIYIRNILNGVLGNAGQAYIKANQATIQYNQSQANLNVALAATAGYITPLLTSLNDLGTTLLTFLAPAIQVVSIYLTAFIQLISEGIEWVGSFFGMFNEGSEKAIDNMSDYRAAMQRYITNLQNYFSDTNSEVNKTTKGINELKKAVMGFDELNVINTQNGLSNILDNGVNNGGLKGNLPTPPNPEDYGINADTIDFSNTLAQFEKAKENIKDILTLVAAVGAGFGLWKLGKFLVDLADSLKTVNALKKAGVDIDANWNSLKQKEIESITHLETIKQKATQIGGIILTAIGSAMALYGWFDSWNNGVDWENLALMIGGVAIAVAGVALAFGKFEAIIATTVAGVAIFITSLKDFLENGASTENVLGLIAGALLTLTPIVYAFNTALAANPIMAVVAAVSALTVGIAALVIEFSKEEKAIKTTEQAQLDLNKATEAATDAKLKYANAIDTAEDSLKKLEEAEREANMAGKDLFWTVENGTISYEDLTQEQKNLYKAYLNNEIKQKEVEKATNELKEAKRQETIASLDNKLAITKETGNYDKYKATVIKAFKDGKISAEDARDALGKSMSEMSDSAQKSFMRDIPDAIKDGLEPSKYMTTGQKLANWFGSLWQNIKDRWNSGTLINGTMIAGEWVASPAMATGGIVTRATTALIGENGREAVLPLENNTEWMDSLADRIASRNNTPSKIVLALDGRELGWANINSINSITRQTGSLQLTLE